MKSFIIKKIVLVVVQKVLNYLITNRDDIIDNIVDVGEKYCYGSDGKVKEGYEWVLAICGMVRDVCEVADDDVDQTNPI